MPNQRYEPRPRKAEIPPRETRYVYHWERIIGVIAILVLGLAGAGYGLYGWLADETSHQQIAVRETAPATASVTADLSEPEDSLENRSTEEPSETPAPPRQSSPATSVIEPGTGQQSAIEPEMEPAPAEPEIQVKPALNEVNPPILSHTAEEGTTPSTETLETQPPVTNQHPPAVSPAPEIDPAPQIADETTTPVAQPRQTAEQTTVDETDTEVESGPFLLQELRILNPQVKRFLLPRAVINKEPRGEIDDIRLKSDASAAVWCYSEVIDRRGSELRYVWYHEGRRMARVRIKVLGNRWRSYSSKVINQRHQGNWRVELQDSKGGLMASAEFTLR
jgi:hypothetical protein